MPRVVHISYPGTGGQAAVCLSSAAEASKTDGGKQGIVFYGNVDPSSDYLRQCREDGYEKVAIRKRGVFGLGARLRLRRWVREFQPDMVICHIPDTALSLGFLRCLPRSTMIVNVEHHSVKLKSGKDWIVSRLAGWCADRVVFLTKSSMDESLRKLGVPGIRAKSVVISNGVEMPEQIPDWEDKKEPFVIGMAGRMDAGKDFGILIHAFSKAFSGDGSARLELAGDGPDRARWESMTEELNLGDKVMFTGMISRKALHEKMDQWSASVLATKGETLSIAILDSWARGIPVVACDIEGVNNLIRDGVDGLLFHPDSVFSLVRGLRHIAGNDIDVPGLREAGRERVVQEFSVSKMWRQYSALMVPKKRITKTPTRKEKLEPC